MPPPPPNYNSYDVDVKWIGYHFGVHKVIGLEDVIALHMVLILNT